MNAQSRRFIASRKTCIVASSHRVYVIASRSVAAREATIAAIIARVGHVSNLTTHIQTHGVEKNVLSHTV